MQTIPLIRDKLRRSRAGPSGGGLSSPGGSIGNILDNVLSNPLDAAINQTYANWDWMTRPYPGPIRPPWAGQFGKRPWPTLGGVPWRPGKPWLPGLNSLGAGLLLQWMLQPPRLDLAGAGWTLCCDVGLPILDGMRIESHSNTSPCIASAESLCGLAGQLTGPYGDVPGFASNQGRSLFIGMKNLGGTRQTHGQIWSKPRGIVTPPVPAIPEQSGPVPVEQPPYTVFAPEPDPMPPIDPYREPPYKPQGDPQPPAYPDDLPLTMPPVRDGVPNYIPVITIVPGDDVGGPTVTPKPPKEPVKEAKLILAINKHTFIGIVLNAVTETVDFIDCFYDALPEDVRRAYERKYGIYGKVSPQQKLYALWQRFAHLDWNQVVHNLAVNQLEDKFFGKIGQLGAVANKLKDATLGYGTGGLQLGYAM